ncbi:hypothetical protein R6G85_02670 [Actinotignum urinale]|uniref:hypothetical protein n=1 Tax=Actinotignum urinale TaxID=190146 RepID=UPI002A82D8DB|nr:hypothetical protein [Actinotignum urinale]MDY5151391.1 hypothetical protein [Actinotignum urinale]
MQKNAGAPIKVRRKRETILNRTGYLGSFALIILLAIGAITSIFSSRTYPSFAGARPISTNTHPKVVVLTSGIEWADLYYPNIGDRAPHGNPEATHSHPSGMRSSSSITSERYERLLSNADKLLHPYQPATDDAVNKLTTQLKSASLFAYTTNTKRSFSCPTDQWLTINTGGRVYDENFTNAIAEQKIAEQKAQQKAAEEQARVDTAKALGHPVEEPAPAQTPAEEVPHPLTTLRCQPVRLPAPGETLPDLERLRTLVSSSAKTLRFGLVGDALAGKKIAAVGNDTALATVTSDGKINATVVNIQPTDVDYNNVLPRIIHNHDLTFIDARTSHFFTSPSSAPRDALDNLNTTLAAIPADAQVLVYSTAPSVNYASLQMGFMYGPGISGGFAYSPSTRHAGLAQPGDITATILSWAGVQVDKLNLPGSVLQTVPENSSTFTDHIQQLTDISTRAIATAQKLGASLIQYTDVALVAIIVLAVIFAVNQGLRRGWAWIGAYLSLWCASIPAALLGISAFPWWNNVAPMRVSVAATVALSFLLAFAARFGPWKHHPSGPMLCVGMFTTAYFLLDIVHGSTILLDSPVGYASIYGARFFGMGNEAYALCTTWVLLMCAFLPPLVINGRWGTFLKKREKLWTNLIICSISVVFIAINGAPQWGADFGGPISFLPGLIVLLLLVNNIQINVKRLLLIGGAGALASAGLAVLDWLRGPENQTHLGKFVQSVVDGDMWPMIAEKIRYNISSWGNMSYTIPFIVTIIFIILVVVPRIGGPQILGNKIGTLLSGPTPRTHSVPPIFTCALIAVAVTLFFGYLLNDSGVIIPSLGFITLTFAYASMLLLCDSRRTTKRESCNAKP